MRHYLVVVGTCIGGSLFATTSHAQSEAASFCSAAGAYMHDIAVRRSGGATKEDAMEQVASDFDAFATDQADLAARRRVLAVGGSLASFAIDLDGLEPATVQGIGEAYCLERGGSVTLAPSSTVSRQFAAAGRQCEAESAGSAEALNACVARGVDKGEVKVARESSLAARGRSKFQPFYEFAASYGGDPVGTILFVGGNTQEIDSGNGISAGGGFLHRITDSFGMKYTAAYKVSFSSRQQCRCHEIRAADRYRSLLRDGRSPVRSGYQSPPVSGSRLGLAHADHELRRRNRRDLRIRVETPVVLVYGHRLRERADVDRRGPLQREVHEQALDRQTRRCSGE